MVFCRWSYLVAMYSGIRAFINRFNNWIIVRRPKCSLMNGTHFYTENLGGLLFKVHSRRRPPLGAAKAEFGMISLCQTRPGIGRCLYWYFCQTSHFGCGHMEIAFYEYKRDITFYAVRNTARSNASRLGLNKIANDMLLVKRNEEAVIILEVAKLLETHGFQTRFAPADECVNLSLNTRLLRLGSQLKVSNTLRRKYLRLSRLKLKSR